MNENKNTKIISAYFKPSTGFVLVIDKTESGSEMEYRLDVTDHILRQSIGFIGNNASAYPDGKNPFGVVAEVSIREDGMDLLRLGNDYPKYRVIRNHPPESPREKLWEEILFVGNFLELNRAFPRDPKGRRESAVDQIAPVYVSDGKIFENKLQIKYTTKSAWVAVDDDPRPSPALRVSVPKFTASSRVCRQEPELAYA